MPHAVLYAPFSHRNSILQHSAPKPCHWKPALARDPYQRLEIVRSLVIPAGFVVGPKKIETSIGDLNLPAAGVGASQPQSATRSRKSESIAFKVWADAETVTGESQDIKDATVPLLQIDSVPTTHTWYMTKSLPVNQVRVNNYVNLIIVVIIQGPTEHNKNEVPLLTRQSPSIPRHRERSWRSSQVQLQRLLQCMKLALQRKMVLCAHSCGMLHDMQPLRTLIHFGTCKHDRAICV